MKIVSKDLINSLIIRENFSDSVIGYLNYENRIDNIINNTVLYNGYYKFLNQEYDFLVSSKCYWFKKEYNNEKGFALTMIDDLNSKIYGEDKFKPEEDESNKCSVVPVIIGLK